jgi:ribosomal protein L7/L12
MTNASSLQQLLDDIKSHVAAGRKIEAIKLYREATGAGLAEAKEAVELIEAGKPPKTDAAPPQPSKAAQVRITAAIAAGNMIEAVRLYREATGLGLKESKDAVDVLAMQVDPAAAETREVAMRSIRRVALLTVLIFAGFALLIAAMSQL